MQVKFLNRDGTVTAVPCVKWHHCHTWKCGPEAGEIEVPARLWVPAGLWVRKSAVVAHYESVNKSRRALGVPERDIRSVIDNIECAEAEVEIYDDDSNDEPWRHNGTLVKVVPYGSFSASP